LTLPWGAASIASEWSRADQRWESRGTTDTDVATLVRFPKVGENIEEGMVGVWHKRQGEWVEKGESLVELITDKATFDLESPESDVLFKVLAAQKSTVPISYVLAVLGADGQALVAEAERENQRLLAEHKARAAHEWREARPSTAHAGTAHVRAMPAARRAAKQAGIRLEEVQPSGPSGVITEADVERHLKGRKGRLEDADQP
jgi:pyruvate dehydrogenase E2 component (dihydrolipoamide acetyltransferase)